MKIPKPTAPLERPAIIHRVALLAAGGGTRWGIPKGLVLVGGRSLLEHHLDAWRAADVPVTVVLGARAAEHRTHEATVVLNPGWRENEAIDSVRCALATYPRTWWFVSPVDTAPPTQATIRLLRQHGATAVPRGPRGDGHPVILSPSSVAEVLAHRPLQGLRSALSQADRVPVAQDVAHNWNHRQRIELNPDGSLVGE